MGLDWANEFQLSKEEVNQIAAPEWIIKNLIISGHIVLIPAEPNGGKTSIMFHLAGEMAKDGYDVFYVNSDISGGDAKPMVTEAKTNEFSLLLPDMKVGKNMDSVLHQLIDMSNSTKRYDDVVFIFDTLKKMANVISKTAAKGLFKLLRKLSAKGMTIILLAHINKYKGEDGEPIYEGTGDLRSDVDELIYLIPQKHPDNSMTVTTKPDKVRGTFEPISYAIDPNRKVTLLDQAVNTTLANQNAADLQSNQTIIDSINLAISEGAVIQKDIIKHCADNSDHGERAVKRVLNKYTIMAAEPIDSEFNEKIDTHIWCKTKGDKNSYIFSKLNLTT